MKNKKILFLVLVIGVLILPFISSAQGSGELCSMIGRVENTVWKIGGSIIVIGWVIAGILYLTAAGNPEKTGIAKKAMIAAIIGTILVVLSATAPAIVIDALGKGLSIECGK